MNIWSLGHAQATLFIVMKNTISLNRNEQFLNVYRTGKRSYHKFFTLYYLPNGKDYRRYEQRMFKIIFPYDYIHDGKLI